MADDALSFGELLRRHRGAAGLTQEALAERAGLSARGIAALESGERRAPHADTVQLLAAALGLPGPERAALEAARGRPTVAPTHATTPPLPSGAPEAALSLNPFFHRGPVHDPAYFFGRAGETRFLADLLQQGQSVAISGPRRLGKTSLLFHLTEPAIAATHGLGTETTRWAYIDGGALDGLDEEWFYGAVDRALDGTEDVVPYARFVERLHGLAARNLRLILALDEFELVAANAAFGPRLFNRLRGLAARFPLQFITASKDPLLALTFAHPDTLSSPFFNIFAPLHLSLLAEAAAAELLATLSARGGNPFGPDLLAWLLDLAGPHPLFLQVAGYRAFSALADEGAGDDLSAAARAAVQAQTLDDLDQHLRYYWSSLDPVAHYTLAALPLLDPEHSSPVVERLTASGLLRGRTYLGGALEAFVRRQVVAGLLQAGPVLMDVRREMAAIHGATVHLTATEFNTLKLFLERPGQVVSLEEIEAILWPDEVVLDPERARGAVKKLRAVLGDAGDVLVNRRGRGYVLSAD